MGQFNQNKVKCQNAWLKVYKGNKTKFKQISFWVSCKIGFGIGAIVFVYLLFGRKVEVLHKEWTINDWKGSNFVKREQLWFCRVKFFYVGAFWDDSNGQWTFCGNCFTRIRLSKA
jgi:hypothetical protein